MNKAETLRQLAASANAKKVEGLTQQIETLRTAKLESVEQLAALLEPLAQAMAALTDDTRETLVSVEKQLRQQGERIARQIEDAAEVCREAGLIAHRSAQRLENAGHQYQGQ